MKFLRKFSVAHRTDGERLPHLPAASIPHPVEARLERLSRQSEPQPAAGAGLLQSFCPFYKEKCDERRFSSELKVRVFSPSGAGVRPRGFVLATTRPLRAETPVVPDPQLDSHRLMDSTVPKFFDTLPSKEPQSGTENILTVLGL
jgi:hypothetical protein